MSTGAAPMGTVESAAAKHWHQLLAEQLLATP